MTKVKHTATSSSTSAIKKHRVDEEDQSIAQSGEDNMPDHEVTTATTDQREDVKNPERG
ncbi:uncharacterized protein EI90DRAFT_3117975 [Cantharellus anzutake]|uniref:uncharacterized protein n=1 Tax=Cantharellus anzutake TaxID=1750568 RepID=UPI00190743D3|nr:uncharacterized protein EI90DRAFT_3117975 [Cantharellus anzutake]KAF8338902.1 hypothetical protein EI90DRAFT_3117975 [Cantharellus anzutake]